MISVSEETHVDKLYLVVISLLVLQALGDNMCPLSEACLIGIHALFCLACQSCSIIRTILSNSLLGGEYIASDGILVILHIIFA